MTNTKRTLNWGSEDMLPWHTLFDEACWDLELDVSLPNEVVEPFWDFFALFFECFRSFFVGVGAGDCVPKKQEDELTSFRIFESFWSPIWACISSKDKKHKWKWNPKNSLLISIKMKNKQTDLYKDLLNRKRRYKNWGRFRN